MSEGDWAGWDAGAVAVIAENRDGSGPAWQRVAGWRKGALFLDYRPHHWNDLDTLHEQAMPWVWVLTHVPTGWGMCGIAMVASEARTLADEIAGMTDWTKVTCDSARFLTGRMQALFARHAGKLVNPSRTIGPWAELRDAQ